MCLRLNITLLLNAAVADSREKSPLLNDIERQDGTSVATRVSINSGLSNAQQIHSRLQVQAELYRRRPSIESGNHRTLIQK